MPTRLRPAERRFARSTLLAGATYVTRDWPDLPDEAQEKPLRATDELVITSMRDMCQALLDDMHAPAPQPKPKPVDAPPPAAPKPQSRG